VLGATHATYLPFGNLYLLESDIDDYFVASYAGRPQLYLELHRVLGSQAGPPTTLLNHEPFSRSTPSEIAFKENREVWGGMFWEIRTKLTRDTADKILADAWIQMPTQVKESDIAATFLKSLLTVADKSSHNAGETIRSVLHDRGFPHPSVG
jgi:hypothetical protein